MAHDTHLCTVGYDGASAAVRLSRQSEGSMSYTLFARRRTLGAGRVLTAPGAADPGRSGSHCRRGENRLHSDNRPHRYYRPAHPGVTTLLGPVALSIFCATQGRRHEQDTFAVG